MAEPKTRKTTVSVSAFIAKVANPVRRRDAKTVDGIMSRITGAKAAMWGPTIIGYGSFDLVMANGKSNPWPVAAFSPRDLALVIYIWPSFPKREALLAKLGPHSIGKSCLYIKRLDDVDLPTLEQLVLGSIKSVRAPTPPRTARVKKGSRAARS
jgi:hypothetical protein